MTFLNNLWADLVDKRLWPVLVALVVVLVAVPVVLLQSGGDSPSPAPAVPSASPTSGGGAVVAVADTATPRVKLRGSRRDPFRGRGNPPGATPTAATAAQTASSGAGSASTAGATTSTGSVTIHGGSGAATPTGTSGGSGGGSGQEANTQGKGGSSSPSQSASPVIIRFGESGGTTERRVVAPLEPLPSRTNPLVVYLGDQDGKAEFLISSDVTPGGDVTCKPSKAVCQKAYVAPGHNLALVVGGPDGNTKYVIEVLSAGS
jgi:hypothetical protein